MGHPTVSFVIPCYKLAHLLPDCVQSILEQTYTDFEILIMDDCSPDNTGEVARSFADHRIRYVRHPKNLGHLQNYNAGIGLSSGKYVWLISADDYLRKPYILQRYVELMDSHPDVGYCFCAGVGVRDGRETEVLQHSAYMPFDCILDGSILLQKLLQYNFILAASGMARRECYDKIGLFPLAGGMGWSADWYLWCAFAVFWKVGYFAEPMVCYREHALSMTSLLTKQQNVHECSEGDIAVPWMIQRMASDHGLSKVVRQCRDAVANQYALQLAGKRYCQSGDSATTSMTMGEIEDSVRKNAASPKERDRVMARIYALMGNKSWASDNRRLAVRFYVSSLLRDPLMLRTYGKLALLMFGKMGIKILSAIRAKKQRAGMPVSVT